MYKVNESFVFANLMNIVACTPHGGACGFIIDMFNI